jgi:NAD-dependent deacetylase
MRQAMSATASCDVFLTVGTSNAVYPAAGLPLQALEHGAAVIEVNPTPTPFSPRATFSLQAPSGVVLPQLLKAITAERK